MALLLVRHAAAMDRASWDRPDALRPLTERGHRQAVLLVDQLAGYDVRRVLSSPATRCYQTIAPLAAARGLAVEPSPALFEGELVAGIRLARELVGGPGAVVLCSHGDVVPAVVDAFAREGLDAGAGEPPCAKGSAWYVEARPAPEGPGQVMGGYYLAPPA